MDDERLLVEALEAARRRAAHDGVSFDLGRGALADLLRRQDQRCALSGVAFCARAYPKAPVVYPFAPSVELLRPEAGYVPGNVRLVTQIAVYIRDHWDRDVVAQLLDATVDRIAETQAGDSDVARVGRASDVADPLDIHAPKPAWTAQVLNLVPALRRARS
jgi:hypothetical protein